jgi:eukaryotic-like serine/threonine-protein kinase
MLLDGSGETTNELPPPEAVAVVEAAPEPVAAAVPAAPAAARPGLGTPGTGRPGLGRPGRKLIAAVVGVVAAVALAVALGVPQRLGDLVSAGSSDAPVDRAGVGGASPGPVDASPAPDGAEEPGAESGTGDAAPVPLSIGRDGRELTDSLASGAKWPPGSGYGGVCANTAGQMSITLPSDGWFKCTGPQDVFGGEQQISVTTTLVTPGACASIWFLMNDPDGYVLHACQDEFRLERQPIGGAKTVIGAKSLASPIPLGTPFQLTIRLGGDRATLWRDSAQVAVLDFAGRPESGRVTLGSSGDAQRNPPPYTVRLKDITVRSTR